MPSVAGIETRAAVARATTWGNPVQLLPLDGVLILPPSIRRAAAVDPDDSLGVGLALDGTAGAVTVEGDLPMYLRYDGLDVLLACFFGQGGAPVKQGATIAYAYNYPLLASLDGIFCSLGIHLKTYVEEIGAVKLDGLTIKGESGKPVLATFRVIAQQKTWNSLVNTLTSMAAASVAEASNRVLFAQSVVRLNDQAAVALSVSHKIYPSSFELAINRKQKGALGQYRTSGGNLQELIDEPTADVQAEVTLKLAFPRHTSNAWLLDLTNDTRKKLDITCTGALIEAPYYRSLVLALPHLQPINADVAIENGQIKEPLEFACLAATIAPAGMTSTAPVLLSGINKRADDPLGQLKFHAPLTPEFGLTPAEGAGPLTFARASSAWHPDGSGVYQQYANNVPGHNGKGVYLEPAATNKVTCYNANPVTTTNLSVGGTGATLTVVDDTAALLAAGLQNICSTGKVFRLLAAAEAAYVYIVIGSLSGVHALSVMVRGTGQAVLWRQGGSSVYSALTAGYVRRTTITDAGSGGALISIQPGTDLYFILPQAEAGAIVTSPIVTAGATATRAATALSVPLSNLRGNNLALTLDVTPAVTVDTAMLLFAGSTATDSLALRCSGGNVIADKTVASASYQAAKAQTLAGDVTTRVGLRLSSAAGLSVFAAGGKGVDHANTADQTAAGAIYLGAGNAGGSPFTGQLANLRVWWEPRSDARLQALTA